jgi:hypothetical protein
VRTIIEDTRVSEVIDANEVIYPRLRDAFDALKWSLCRRPEDGELLDDENWLYKQMGDERQNVPSLVVIYTFDHNFVSLKFILVRLPSL